MKKLALLLLLLLVIPSAVAIDKQTYKSAVAVEKQAYGLSPKEDVAHTNSIIMLKGLNWVAGETSVSNLSLAEKKAMLLKDRQVRGGPTVSLAQKEPSAAFDWRNKDGEDWLTSVKDQGRCGSCWAFSTVGALESRIKIALNDSSYDINLSEQDLVSCSGAGTCSGGYEGDALEAMSNTGIVRESCFPYSATEKNCSNKCSDWKNQTVRILSYNLLPANPSEIKQAIEEYGPVTAYMAVFEDFFTYKKGIYSRAEGTFLGFHAILIVGYNDVGRYWICKNSWGTNWGEEGYFRISYDENILNYLAWAYNPYDYRTLFLDESYVVTDSDLDGDAVGDSLDNCPFSYNPSQDDLDKDSKGDICDEDIDGDLINNTEDNCIFTFNPDQLDQDGNGLGDLCDTDLDGDSINNTEDNCPWVANSDQKDVDGDSAGDACDMLTGGLANITANFNLSRLLIRGSPAFYQNLSGINNVSIEDENNDTVLLFEWNFSKPLYFPNITILKQKSSSVGSIIVNGLDVSKTVYFDKLNSSSNAVCVKDETIANISQISSDCSGASEVSIECPSTGVYNCSFDGSRYKVSGLTHSGVKEYYIAPPPAPPAPHPHSPSGGGGGGGSKSPSADAITEPEPAVKTAPKQEIKITPEPKSSAENTAVEAKPSWFTGFSTRLGGTVGIGAYLSVFIISSAGFYIYWRRYGK